jgi:hypothetical protein
MTRDELINLATQSGFSVTHTSNLGVELYLCNPKDIERFAKLVAAKEREACAKVAEEWVRAYPHPSGIIENNILARGQKL